MLLQWYPESRGGVKPLVLISGSITKRPGVMTVRVDDFRPAVDSYQTLPVKAVLFEFGPNQTQKLAISAEITVSASIVFLAIIYSQSITNNAQDTIHNDSHSVRAEATKQDAQRSQAPCRSAVVQAVEGGGR